MPWTRACKRRLCRLREGAKDTCGGDVLHHPSGLLAGEGGVVERLRRLRHRRPSRRRVREGLAREAVPEAVPRGADGGAAAARGERAGEDVAGHAAEPLKVNLLAPAPAKVEHVPPEARLGKRPEARAGRRRAAQRRPLPRAKGEVVVVCRRQLMHHLAHCAGRHRCDAKGLRVPLLLPVGAREDGGKGSKEAALAKRRVRPAPLAEPAARGREELLVDAPPNTTREAVHAGAARLIEQLQDRNLVDGAGVERGLLRRGRRRRSSVLGEVCAHRGVAHGQLEWTGRTSGQLEWTGRTSEARQVERAMGGPGCGVGAPRAYSARGMVGQVVEDTIPA